MENNFSADIDKLNLDELDNNELNLFNSYLSIAELNSSLKNIMEIIIQLNNQDNITELLKFILNKSLNLITEADYGRIFLKDSGKCGCFLEKVYQNTNTWAEIDCKSIFKKREKTDINFKNIRNPKNLIIELKINDNILGAIILYIEADKRITFSEDSKKLALSLERLASFYLKIKSYSSLQQNFTKEVVLSLSNLLSIHDHYTRGHNKNVAVLSKKIAELMDLKQKKIEDAYWTGILHDIGKTVIPARILNKNGKLNKKEFELIKKHPFWGYQTLKDSPGLKKVAEYILHHHECWDGSGYPDSLSGENIPLISRIIAVADAWDAMTTDRSYRKALTKKEASAELKKGRGSQFSPRIIDVFLYNKH